MNLMKKIAIASLSIVAALSLSACGKSSSSPRQNTWQRAEQSKSITIGFDNTFVPMGFKDKDGVNKGFDIDLANAVFKEYGIKVKWQPINWSMKEAELKKGDIDLIWNGYGITKEREQQVLFSEPYMASKQEILNKKSSNITKVEDMKGKTAGVQAGSSGYSDFNDQPKVLKNYLAGKTISQYSNFDQALLDLQNGRIDGVLIDQTYADYYLNQKGLTKDYSRILLDYGVEPSAVGARKSDKELVNKINQGINKLVKDGQFAQISQKWFGRNVWPGKLSE
ncbi:amino acid ABC transporter substrate-binding protein [Lactococcus termiticola]|nr:amino acid ABC transporter substrate-binding protein [Lactococcus termiticola]